MRSRSFLPLVVVAAEVLVYLRYQAFGAEFHFWLHGMVGGTLGLGALATLRLLRPGRRPPSMWAAAGAGHAYAAFPDVLFLGAGLLHVWWMDVFALHVRIHFVPAPLATMFVGFSLALTAAVAVELQARRTAAFALATLVIVLAVAFARQHRVPAGLHEKGGAPAMAGVSGRRERTWSR